LNMSVAGSLLTTLIVGGTGIIIGFFLGFAGEKLELEVDPREEEVLGVLPMNNCGACGFPGCASLATAIVKEEAEVNGCPVGGADVAGKVGEIMGVEALVARHVTAFVKCSGTPERAKKKFVYSGEQDCTMLGSMPNGGDKACAYGCLGFGNCMRVCPFDSIHIVDGLAVVDRETCRACKKCVKECPRQMIELMPYDQQERVACFSKDKGKDVMDACSVGCIGCRICEKNCPVKAIVVTDNLAYIDESICTGCGICKEKCPRKSIV
jgi:Na+-translocating ferredoxin:NAD+ oxidoreductase RNF subunit RnfB